MRFCIPKIRTTRILHSQNTTEDVLQRLAGSKFRSALVLNGKSHGFVKQQNGVFVTGPLKKKGLYSYSCIFNLEHHLEIWRGGRRCFTDCSLPFENAGCYAYSLHWYHLLHLIVRSSCCQSCSMLTPQPDSRFVSAARH